MPKKRLTPLQQVLTYFRTAPVEEAKVALVVVQDDMKYSTQGEPPADPPKRKWTRRAKEEARDPLDSSPAR